MDDALTLDRVPDHIARAVVDPHAYAEFDSLHAKLTELRRDHPFARADIEGYDKFWIASKHKDIQEISRNSDVFRAGIYFIGTSKDIELEYTKGKASQERVLTSMNSPEHMKYRLLTQPWFQPKNLRGMEERIRRIARRHVDEMAELGGECEFYHSIAVHYPLRVIMSIMGLEEEAEPFMMRLTQIVTNMDDPDLTGEPAPKSAEERAQRSRAISDEAWQFFNGVSEQRRTAPTDDISTVLANAKVDGEPISDLDALGYYMSIAIAGHDTTSASVSGAIWALAERPDKFAQVTSNLSLIPNLVDEAVRWTTPISHFLRTAGQDTVYRGQPIAKGDFILLSYTSGNRDEDVFEDPFEFKVDRPTMRHIGFGYGAHVCLGQHLARMEMNILFEELLPRLKSLELTGTPKRKITHALGGPKFVPIRYKMS
ncbi:cytochrome P450 [Sphingomonas sp. MG17]|jgi:cytochrome P450|uniref:Cytochrome P450 n=1 Tax=Sphingomonas tagetis TaxID=2949092 RepID=A0A9X2HQ73_9SPHN|nr:cytochrome P450 [Sphingomonas tagetis]MCP3730565.1 cytochrome P450 [Sphingomonas tagetis]